MPNSLQSGKYKVVCQPSGATCNGLSQQQQEKKVSHFTTPKSKPFGFPVKQITDYVKPFHYSSLVMCTWYPSLFGRQAALEWFIDRLRVSGVKTEPISAPGSAAICTTTTTTKPVIWSHDKHLRLFECHCEFMKTTQRNKGAVRRRQSDSMSLTCFGEGVWCRDLVSPAPVQSPQFLLHQAGIDLGWVPRNKIAIRETKWVLIVA